MQSYKFIGIHFKNVPLSWRGRLSLAGQRRDLFLRIATHQFGFCGFVLSTCNRTEIYFTDHNPEDILAIWSQVCGLNDWPEDIPLNYGKGFEVFDHLLEMACGYDSQIPGDNEIIGQLKEGFFFAKENYQVDGILEKGINYAIAASRKVKAETSFNDGIISIPYQITDRIRSRYQNKFRKPDILLIGCGQMIRLTYKYLASHLPEYPVSLTNRTLGKANAFAREQNGKVTVIPFDQVAAQLNRFDIIISAIQVEKPVFTLPGDLGKTKMIFDLGVPANLPVKEEHNGQYYDVDSLHENRQEQIHQRLQERQKVQHILSKIGREFRAWHERRLYWRERMVG